MECRRSLPVLRALLPLLLLILLVWDAQRVPAWSRASHNFCTAGRRSVYELLEAAWILASPLVSAERRAREHAGAVERAGLVIAQTQQRARLARRAQDRPPGELRRPPLRQGCR